LNSREFYKTTGFKEIAYIYGDTNVSFRKTADLINRSRWQLQGGTPYLERNTPYIPCYAIRKKLGLRNSSSIGEKMNDLIVSSRQKHNGMSWSKDGSVALATITSLKRNRENNKWFEERELNYKLAS
jgi:hypothetical protein